MYGGDKPFFHYIKNPIEFVNYIKNRAENPYLNTYNPDWKDHPNLRWGGIQGGGSNSNQVKKNNYQPPNL